MRHAAILALVALAAGCGGDDDVAAPPCPPAAVALAEEPDLPPGFPTPEGVTYTAAREAGPSTLVDGFHDELLEEAFESYKDAFESAPGYAVTQEEREQLDAEVNFEGGGTDGQVRLRACEGRTDLTITIRPL